MRLMKETRIVLDEFDLIDDIQKIARTLSGSVSLVDNHDTAELIYLEIGDDTIAFIDKTALLDVALKIVEVFGNSKNI